MFANYVFKLEYLTSYNSEQKLLRNYTKKMKIFNAQCVELSKV